MVDLILLVVVIAVAVPFLVLGDPRMTEPIPYWQILLLSGGTTLALALLRHGLALGAHLDSWLPLSIGCALGLCVAEALKRRRARKRKT